jgi:hypothetical protein
LYQGQLALARIGAGEPVQGLRALLERLADAPCGQGYGQFVLGELAYEQGDLRAAKRYLQTFVRRTRSGRVALEIALGGELARAEALLEAIAKARRS